jgi:hypothetical protein
MQGQKGYRRNTTTLLGTNKTPSFNILKRGKERSTTLDKTV